MIALPPGCQEVGVSKLPAHTQARFEHAPTGCGLLQSMPGAFPAAGIPILLIALSLPAHTTSTIITCAMQAARQAGGLPLLGFALARPITNLRDLLPCLMQRLSFATHGVGDGNRSTDGGVPRFYKTVHVKEVLDQVPPPPPLPPPLQHYLCC